MSNITVEDLRFWLDHLDDPDPVESSSSSSSLVATIISNCLLFCLIFGLSATVSIDSLKRQLSNKFAILAGIGVQFLVMPLLGFLAVIIRQGDGFTHAMGISLLVVTSSPGGSYSNWWCSLFNAEIALSVAMTAISTILAVGMLPGNLLFYSHLAYGINKAEDMNVVASLDFGTLFISLGIVMGGIILGLYASYKIRNNTFSRWANSIATLSGVALVLVSVVLSNSGTESKLWNKSWKFYVGVAVPCLFSMAGANIISRAFRLSGPERVAISIECCYQNTGIATSVAVTMFTDPEIRAQAVAVPLFYGMVEVVVIAIYSIIAWKAGWTKAPANENFCVVISKTYEVEDSLIGVEDEFEFEPNLKDRELT